MPVVITTLGLGRTRKSAPTPEVTVNGTGFSAANNSVFVSGTPAAINTQGTTQITFDLPLPFGSAFGIRSAHFNVLVVNDDTGEVSTDAYVWIKDNLSDVADIAIETPIPGPFEITSAPERPDRFEARDMVRLSSLIELLTTDVADGNVLAHDGAKLAQPTAPTGAGQVLLVDAVEATGLKWGFKLDAFLLFGITLSQAQVLGAFAGNSGINPPGSPPSRENWALDDGTLDLVSLRGRSSGGGTLVLVRVLVDGIQQYTSGAISVITYSQAINVAVTKGQQVELEVTCSNGLGHGISLVGGVRLLVD